MWMHVDKWYFQACSHRPIKQLSFRGSDTGRHVGIEVIRMWSPTRVRCLKKCLTCWHQNGGNGRVVPHNDLTKSAHLDNRMEKAYKYIQSFVMDHWRIVRQFIDLHGRPRQTCPTLSMHAQNLDPGLPDPLYWHFKQNPRPLMSACLVYGLMNLRTFGCDSEGRPLTWMWRYSVLLDSSSKDWSMC